MFTSPPDPDGDKDETHHDAENRTTHRRVVRRCLRFGLTASTEVRRFLLLQPAMVLDLRSRCRLPHLRLPWLQDVQSIFVSAVLRGTQQRWISSYACRCMLGALMRTYSSVCLTPSKYYHSIPLFPLSFEGSTGVDLGGRAGRSLGVCEVCAISLSGARVIEATSLRA
ncbi:hypothetical protein C8R44DRAFT_886770 [Mycena epipterygia]|nr:hypothetical protein C8R44DRAFT_886770 [Mycena epipterygia]